jgi:hypothetical protein
MKYTTNQQLVGRNCRSCDRPAQQPYTLYCSRHRCSAWLPKKRRKCGNRGAFEHPELKILHCHIHQWWAK